MHWNGKCRQRAPRVATSARPNSGKAETPSLGTYDIFMMRLDIPSNSRIDAACRALDELGYKFLTHYGLDNAESILEGARQK